jgi:hypothetical protein
MVGLELICPRVAHLRERAEGVFLAGVSPQPAQQRGHHDVLVRLGQHIPHFFSHGGAGSNPATVAAKGGDW